MENQNCSTCDWHGWAGNAQECHNPDPSCPDAGHETDAQWSCDCWESEDD